MLFDKISENEYPYILYGPDRKMAKTDNGVLENISSLGCLYNSSLFDLLQLPYIFFSC